MDIPPSPGTYVLVLHLDDDRAIAVGRLGEFLFRAGHYLYVGSARGPGGLRARLGRHLHGRGCPHWHVDYLRRWTRPAAVWYNVGARLECAWRETLQKGGLALAVPHFGASDCRCPGHLLYSFRRPAATLLAESPGIIVCLPT